MIQQTKTRPQEALDFKINKQMDTFSFSPPKNLIKEGKWLKSVTFFETTNSVFKMIDENNSFSITIPGHWNSESAEKTLDDRNILVDLRSENDIKLHAEQVKKKRTILIKDYSLSSLGTFESEILGEIKF